MRQRVEKATVPKLGTLLQEHQEAVTLGREFIRLAIRARVADQIDDALIALQAAEDCIAKAVRLEERLRGEL
jgi:hypothetical protein